jgi:hypothetical protein
MAPSRINVKPSFPRTRESHFVRQRLMQSGVPTAQADAAKMRTVGARAEIGCHRPASIDLSFKLNLDSYSFLLHSAFKNSVSATSSALRFDELMEVGKFAFGVLHNLMCGPTRGSILRCELCELRLTYSGLFWKRRRFARPQACCEKPEIVMEATSYHGSFAFRPHEYNWLFQQVGGLSNGPECGVPA